MTSEVFHMAWRVLPAIYGSVWQNTRNEDNPRGLPRRRRWTPECRARSTDHDRAAEAALEGRSRSAPGVVGWAGCSAQPHRPSHPRVLQHAAPQRLDIQKRISFASPPGRHLALSRSEEHTSELQSPYE